MIRRRPALNHTDPWSDSSLVFSDTQRVDLFDDPRWETRPVSPAKSASLSPRAVRQATRRVFPFRRTKRGLHSLKSR
jgi:hypothetical protein